jgi:hypothetical protein
VLGIVEIKGLCHESVVIRIYISMSFMGKAKQLSFIVIRR